MNSKWIYPVFIAVFTLASFEVLLRIRKVNQVWSESVGKDYFSGYNQSYPTHFYSWSQNAEFDFDQKEFKFHYKTNSLGIREREKFYTDSNATRILCLGDSYTEGFGAPYDSSYPKLLEKLLTKQGFHYQVYNAGIAGSDPFYAYKLFKEKLRPAHPKYMFITFNSSDLTDFIYLGGMERFKSDGTVKGRKGPWYEPLYKSSYLFRFFINSILSKVKQNLFLTQKEFEHIYCPMAVQQITNVFKKLNQMGKEDGFEFMVIIQPISNELTKSNDDNDFTRSVFGAMEDSLKAHDIKVIDMWKALDGKITAQNEAEFSYQNDCHYTPAGYCLFTDNLLNAIDKKYPNYWN